MDTTTAQNTKISSNFLLCKFCRIVQFPKNFQTRKLNEITVLCAVNYLNKTIIHNCSYHCTKNEVFH